MELHGFLDGVSDDRIYGWAWDPTRPGARVEVELRIDGQLVARVRADRERGDLASAGIGDGRHGFELSLGPLADGRRHVVEVLREDGHALTGSPWRGRIGAAGPETAPRFRSRFGGPWTDLSNAEDVIEGRRELGLLDDAEASLLTTWVRDGYVILRGAVPEAALSALRAEIDRLFAGGDERVWVERFEPIAFERLKPEHRAMPVKVLDLHAHLETVRRVAFAEPIRRFLVRLFERPPLAFQSLYFERGLGQPIHRDTAYVRVSSPLEMAAAWIALEPIRAGSGELELYAGSHALPEELFEGGSKWLRAPRPEYSARLREECELAGLRYERFIARPGDVLLWSADLAHGGSTVSQPALTRRSLVVHYCPSSVDPIYDGASAPRIEHARGCRYTYAMRG